MKMSNAILEFAIEDLRNRVLEACADPTVEAMYEEELVETALYLDVSVPDYVFEVYGP